MKCVDFDSKKAELICTRFINAEDIESYIFLFDGIYDKYFEDQKNCLTEKYS